MIEINEIEWDDLKDAYGTATDIPNLLQRVIADKASKHDLQSGPWFELWSRLCHQGTIYSASYAAVPIIVEAAVEAKGAIAMDFFLLPASIELSRDENGSSVPENIQNDYRDAIKKLGEVAGRYVDSNEPNLRKAALAAQFVSQGNFNEARNLIDA